MTNQPVATQTIKYLVVPYSRGIGIDLGCGEERIWPRSIGIDHTLSPNGAAIARDIRNLGLFQDQSLDYVFSANGLNRFSSDQTLDTLKEWWRVIKPEGYLILYLHHKNPQQPDAKPTPPCNIKEHTVMEWMRAIGESGPHGVTIEVNDDRSTDHEQAHLHVFRKIQMPGFHASSRLSGRKRALVIRYGGFGDILQASSVFPGLKQQGYDVWVNTTPKGRDILACDPNIDGWWLQDDDQIPNHELGLYWQTLREHFDRVINLSESVEGTLLTIPNRVNDHWHDDARRLLLNHNHMKVVHTLAGVPEGSRLKFHPSAAEERQARRMRQALGSGPVILWVLSGSSIHKSWPYVDHVLAALLMERPEARIVLVGDDACRILEAGWRLERRVLRRSGRWSIRRTLSFASHVDVLVGPETGVMNAMGLEKVGKVLFLSHSSIENISSHWTNTISLKPPAEVTCYPCHRLHYGWERCHRDARTGAAWCAAAISPDRTMAAILFLLGEFHEKR
ncbi:MAG: methyltransferase domain-containing protein [Magnetococcales bacterium]|nr:methyltransferase domain-containing protein [Magnetococcales bacterium]